MISHLISTIIMALGVATGNISSNAYKGGNAFYNEKVIEDRAIQPKKAPQTYTYNYQFEYIGAYDDTPNDRAVIKYYIKEQNQQIITSNVSTLYYNISNTTYQISRHRIINSQHYNNIALASVFVITTYFNTEDMDITLKQDVYWSELNNTSATLYRTIDNYISNTNLSNLIDLTLNANTVPTLMTLFDDNIKTERENEVNQIHYANSNFTEEYTNDYTIESIQSNTTISVVVLYALEIYSAVNQYNGLIVPQTLKIEANALLPTVNYEVVDIPNLMYTIITMPFSFISTAFNLTVFGGTPYALNFGNLFLTIVAAFILLWIIRKVLK